MNTDDDDSGSTRQQKRQEGAMESLARKKHLVARNGNTAMQQVGGALEVKFEGNAQRTFLTWQLTPNGARVG